MVGAPVEAPIETPTPVEEQAPVVEPEETPQIDLGESPEETGEETPAEEAPDPVAALQSQIAALTEKIDELRSQPRPDPEQVREAERARLRMEQEQQQRDRDRSQAEQEEMEEAISATLISQGVDPQLLQTGAVRKAAERIINKRYDQIANKEIGHVSEALKWVRGFAEKGEAPYAISGRASQYAGQLADDFNAIYGTLKSQAQTTADLTSMKADDLIKRLSADQIKAIHAHESGRLGAQTRTSTKPLKRPEGQLVKTGPLTIEEASTLPLSELKRRTGG